MTRASVAWRSYRQQPARVAVVLVLMLAMGGLAGCSVSPGDRVAVTMHEWSISAAPQSARSGRVRIEVDSVGQLPHNLALIRGSDASALRLKEDGSIDLVANRPIDEIEEFKPGHYLGVSPNLLAGDYLLVCTLTTGADGQPLNHFAQGMHTRFTVIPKTKDDV